ncbi:MAG: AEC family transporter, partial [Clostridia bacterium]|nr:AEC family transporter [Clostridia bacterium]
LAMYFARLQFPAVLGETFSFVGGVTPPLTMLITGSILAEYPIKNMLSEIKVKLLLVLKMLLLPVLALLLAKLFFGDPVIVGLITLTFAMPCGSMCAMLSKEYGVNADTASSGVVFSTVLSLVTIPLVYLALSRFF